MARMRSESEEVDERQVNDRSTRSFFGEGSTVYAYHDKRFQKMVEGGW